MRSRIRAQRLAAATLTALLAFAGAIAPVTAWSNRGDGYGTHDWILDQAFRLLDARGINMSWVDRDIALKASDDPDTIEVAADPSRKIEHTYTATGRRGGAIHRITEHYADILHAYDAHDYDEASYQLGMLSHFYADLSMPYHTNQGAQTADAEHEAYELLVNNLMRAPTDKPGWSVANTNWNVSNMPNVRTAAVAMAAYSRARYQTVHDNFEPNDTSLSRPVENVTKEVMIRVSGDLADLVQSVPKGIGNPPAVGSLQLWARWHGVKGNERNQLIYGKVKDVNGDLMEGVRVDVTFPDGNGGTKTWPFWTDETGEGHVRIEVGNPALMDKKNVSGKVKTDQTSVTEGDWYYRTLKLADGANGFWTDVSDRSVVQGQKVTVKTYARTPGGAPIQGLLVDWTWDLGGTAMKTTGWTDSNGRATTSFVIQSGTTHAQVYVYAHTTAYSLNRKSKTWFQRSD